MSREYINRLISEIDEYPFEVFLTDIDTNGYYRRILYYEYWIKKGKLKCHNLF